jgi:ACS family glucarate transporter-like MFS transporter
MSKKRTLVYIGIFLLIGFNYVDRIALSVAAPSLTREFGLSTVQMGYLLSSFIWTYLVCLIPMGILTDRFGSRIVNAVGVAVWSAATVLTGFAWSFATMLCMRLVMGAAEASSYPAGGRALREWAPRSEYGLAATMLNSGGYAGPAAGTLLISWVVSLSDWRMGFIVAGLIGLVWLAGWLIWYRRPEDATFLSANERAFILKERDAGRPQQDTGSFTRLLRSPSMWAVALSQGCAVYTQILFLTWLPSYLATEKHLSIMKTGLFTALPYFIAVFASWALAHLSDRMLHGSHTGTGQRRWMVFGAMLSAAVVLLAPLVDSVPLILLLFTVSLTGLSTGISLNIALAGDLLQSPADAGKAMGIQISGGNVFGLMAPIVTGYVIAYTGGYNWAFIIGGLLLLVGAAITMTLTRSPIGVPMARPAVALG